MGWYRSELIDWCAHDVARLYRLCTKSRSKCPDSFELHVSDRPLKGSIKLTSYANAVMDVIDQETGLLTWNTYDDHRSWKCGRIKFRLMCCQVYLLETEFNKDNLPKVLYVRVKS